MTLIASLPQQSFNDALYCLEKIQQSEENKNAFAYWTYSTWSIVSASICMESYLTQYIRDNLRPLGKEQDFLNRRIYFHNKITYLQEELDSTIPSYDSEDFARIRASRTTRNDIIHYRKYNIFNEITKQHAIDAIESCRDLIKLILEGHGKDYNQEAKWINKTKSEPYDKA